MSDDAERYGPKLDDLHEEELKRAARDLAADMDVSLEDAVHALKDGLRPRCQVGARLCKPKVRIKPSGRRLFHADDCPDKPGEPIYANEYLGSSWRNPTPWRR